MPFLDRFVQYRVDHRCYTVNASFAYALFQFGRNDGFNYVLVNFIQQSIVKVLFKPAQHRFVILDAFLSDSCNYLTTACCHVYFAFSPPFISPQIATLALSAISWAFVLSVVPVVLYTVFPPMVNL